MSKYESKAAVKTFGGVSRSSVKIKDSFYTFEASATKDFPEDVDMNDVDMLEEFKILYNELHDQVDMQIEEVEKSYFKN